ncbi:MAG TPA: ABC transporter permease subunit [Lacipirellulaceae bacterium]|nr:ABC transporter permease subunit [Lacipirellulaceae bacterium]
MSKLAIWLTPLWVLAVGMMAGAAALLVAWGICRVVNRRAADAIASAVAEGILRPISYVLVTVAVLALLATPTMPVRETVASLQRAWQVAPVDVTVTVPANTADARIPAEFRSDELQEYSIQSEQDVAINTDQGKGYVDPVLTLEGGETFRWYPGSPWQREFTGDVSALYVTNETDSPSKVTVKLRPDVVMPEVHSIPVAAASVVGLYLAYFVIRFLFPRAAVIATATAKETVSQPMFVLLTALGVVALISYVFIPYNTFGEDVKMLKTSGMTTIKVLAIIMALWTASASVADEIEGRTALTVLSKPVSRRQFVLGKFLGILWPIVLMFVILGLVFLLTVSFKVVYDAREASKTTPEWQECYVEVVRIIPGLVLSLFESIVLAAISVAVSTRLPMLPNLIICGSVYVLGHLAALIVKSSVGHNVFVKFVGRLLSVVLPVLDHYEIEGAIAGATVVPASYLAWALLYSALYCAAAMLLALVFFEDRDLA